MIVKSFNQISHWIHHYFFYLLLGTYLLAALFPGVGQQIRGLEFGTVHWLNHESLKVTAMVLMLSFLLFNAGLGIKAKELIGLRERPWPLLLGVTANLLVPIGFILFLLLGMRFWHDPEELQHLLVGLALIISMPIAGSSAAWSQNANGNLTLSLGLVVLSTLISPFLTPMVLHLFGFLTTGDYAEDLHELATSGTGAFLYLSVVIPSLLGILVHFVVGEGLVQKIKPYLKLVNSINLLLLSYVNAALVLPQVLKAPDWDFLAFIAMVTFSLCFIAFGAGWVISKLLKTDDSERSSLMFGLGMNNNGTGLVLSSIALADHSGVMLPIIFYNLAQQIIAGVVDMAFERSNRQESTVDQPV